MGRQSGLQRQRRALPARARQCHRPDRSEQSRRRHRARRRPALAPASNSRSPATCRRQFSIVGAYTYQEAEFVRAISASVQDRSPKSPTRPGTAPRFGAATTSRLIWASASGATYQGRRVRRAGQSRPTSRLRPARRCDLLPDQRATIDVQVNVENLLDEHYFVYAHSNSNISPGSPTSVRGAINFRF